jgi:predicted dehydrogenase
MHNDVISIGIIGAGGIANSVHLPSLKDIEGINICCICDQVIEKAQSASEKYNIPNIYDNYKVMIQNEKLDGIFVLVQPDQIFRIAYDTIMHGIHTFIEKPAGITLYQTESLARIASQNNRILQVGMNRRYIPLIQTIVNKMRKITPITQIEGCFVKNSDAAFYGGCASAFICDTIHAIDIISWIADSDAASAATVVGKVNSVVDNSWNSVIRFKNGTTGILKANYQTGGRVHTFEIHGPNASAYIDIGFGGQKCEGRILYRKGSGTFSISSAGGGGFEIEELDGIQLAGSSKYYRYYGYYYEDLEFINSIRKDEKSFCDIDSALKSMQLADFILANVI